MRSARLDSPVTRPSDRPPALPGERAEALLAGLQEIFAVEGFRRVSMADLAARLRCSKGTLYCLAPSKETLFMRVLARTLDEIWRRGLEAERLTVDPIARIHEYVVAALVPIRNWSPVFLTDVQRLPPARKLLDEHLDQRMRRLEQMVAGGIASGVFREVNPALVAGLLYASAFHFCSPKFLDAAGLNLTEAVEQLCTLVWHGLVTTTGARRAHRRTASSAVRARSRHRVE